MNVGLDAGLRQIHLLLYHKYPTYNTRHMTCVLLLLVVVVVVCVCVKNLDAESKSLELQL